MSPRENNLNGLLQADTPSIRLLALTKLKALPVNDPQVIQEQKQVDEQEPVISILKEQQPEGFWIWEHSYYTPKYRSSHWSMQLLTELGLSVSLPTLQQGALYMRKRMQPVLAKKLDQNLPGLACFWGNFLKYQLYCQQLADPTVQKVVEMLTHEIEADAVCPYNDNLPCAWGLIRSLWGLAAIPAHKRSPEVEHAIQHGLEFILERYSLVKADYPYKEKIHKSWFSLNFPLFYNTDILFTLRVLQELDALKHPSARQALDWLASKQLKSGWWRGASPARSRTWAFTSGQDTVNHWATLYALSLLK